jgi:hypothetical protein
LAAIPGDSVKNLSANTVMLLKQVWIKEYFDQLFSFYDFPAVH